jgi:hypothetical protein
MILCHFGNVEAAEDAASSSSSNDGVRLLNLSRGERDDFVTSAKARGVGGVAAA